MMASEEGDGAPSDASPSGSPLTAHAGGEETKEDSLKKESDEEKEGAASSPSAADRATSAAEAQPVVARADPRDVKDQSGFSKSFPRRLLEVLSREDTKNALLWMPDGLSFVIISPRAFVSSVLPRFFKQTKFASFTRKLNRWGFKRITNGQNAGAYYHKLFQRDNPDLCLQMRCQRPGDSTQPEAATVGGKKRKLSTDQSLEPSPFPPGYMPGGPNLGSMLLQSLPGPGMGGGAGAGGHHHHQQVYHDPTASQGAMMGMMPVMAGAGQGFAGGMGGGAAMLSAGVGGQGPFSPSSSWQQQQQHQQQQQRLYAQLRADPSHQGVPHQSPQLSGLGGVSEMPEHSGKPSGVGVAAGVGVMGDTSTPSHAASLSAATSVQHQQQMLANLQMQQQQLEALHQQLQQQQQMQQQLQQQHQMGGGGAMFSHAAATGLSGQQHQDDKHDDGGERKPSASSSGDFHSNLGLPPS